MLGSKSALALLIKLITCRASHVRMCVCVCVCVCVCQVNLGFNRNGESFTVALLRGSPEYITSGSCVCVCARGVCVCECVCVCVRLS